MNFFNKTELGKELNNIESSLNTMEKNKAIIFNNSINTFDIKSSVERTVLPSFKDYIFPENDDIKKNQIRDLYIKYIHNGPDKGKLHVFDENNICIISGMRKDDLLLRDYDLEDYNNLVRSLHKENQKVFKLDIDSDNLTINRINDIKNVINSNKFLMVW